jgi:hypothetical protein
MQNVSLGGKAAGMSMAAKERQATQAWAGTSVTEKLWWSSYHVSKAVCMYAIMEEIRGALISRDILYQRSYGTSSDGDEVGLGEHYLWFDHVALRGAWRLS